MLEWLAFGVGVGTLRTSNRSNFLYLARCNLSRFNDDFALELGKDQRGREHEDRCWYDKLSDDMRLSDNPDNTSGKMLDRKAFHYISA